MLASDFCRKPAPPRSVANMEDYYLAKSAVACKESVCCRVFLIGRGLRSLSIHRNRRYSMMKRIVAFIVVACIMCVGLTTSFAYSGNHGANWVGRGSRRATTPVECTVEGCACPYNHYHGNVLCYGHCNEDGTCYGPCSVEGCPYQGYHTHNGCGYYGCGHGHGMGCGHHAWWNQ